MAGDARARVLATSSAATEDDMSNHNPDLKNRTADPPCSASSVPASPSVKEPRSHMHWALVSEGACLAWVPRFEWLDRLEPKIDAAEPPAREPSDQGHKP